MHIIRPEIFPNLISNLAIAALALGAFTVAMASLVNSKSNLSMEAINYRLLAEDFINSGVYFLFSYLFWMVVTYNEKTSSDIISSIVNVYSIFTVLSLFIGIILLISGMWKLVNTNN